MICPDPGTGSLLHDRARFKSSDEEGGETVSSQKGYSVFTLVPKFSQEISFQHFINYLPIFHPDYSNLGYLTV